MIYDLHVHTNYSDGLLSPEQVVELATNKKVDGIAITDHDTTEGIYKAKNYSRMIEGPEIIPGIEFSSVHNDEEVHILGYFIDYNNPDMINITTRLRHSRVNRGIKMIENINRLSINITLEDVKQFCGDGYIGRPHIARAMTNKGYVSSIKEAFEKYLNRGRPGYIEGYKIPVVDVIGLIKKSGGVSVLAHPGLLKDKNIIDYCINKGIDGLECIHSKHDENHISYLLQKSRENDLIITGGSDCHGELFHGETLLGNYYIGLESILEMKRRI